ncbi:MAG: protein kinase, partial [Deltaproteobacteria bacterium]|nr:protein kinase [Deltaproteobacteria bacterium]
GAELSAVLERSGRLPARIVVRIVLELARALGELHRRGIVHCNVCPENVLVSRWGEIKLTGLGHAQQVGEAEPPSPAPTTPYSAPELREGGGADPQVDVFSLGVLLHVLLLGSEPGHSGGPVLAAHPQLAWLIRRCLRQEPTRRPDLLSVRRRLERALPTEDSRMEIAAWFWDVRMLRPSLPELPEQLPTAASPPVTRGLPRWALPAAAAGGLLLAVLLTQLGGSNDVPQATAPARPLPEVAAVEPAEELPAVLAGEPGLVAFVAYPWAEIQIDEQAPFLTPRAAPIELAPGSHQLLFRHPRYGEVRESIVIRPGEQRLVRHVFAGAQPR